MSTIPDIRVRACNSAPLREKGDFVLYWMIAFRRLGWNFALERAAEHAQRLGKPLVILEPLRCGYRWANDRLHRMGRLLVARDFNPGWERQRGLFLRGSISCDHLS